jgi:hypothetical protein
MTQTIISLLAQRYSNGDVEEQKVWTCSGSTASSPMERRKGGEVSPDIFGTSPIYMDSSLILVGIATLLDLVWARNAVSFL